MYDGAQPKAIEGGKLYTGSCHCGRVKLALMNKPLEENDDSGMVRCNCSICERVSKHVLLGKRRGVSKPYFQSG